MRLIHDLKDISATRATGAAGGWTALIPAAGRGSRLHFAGPKILYPILGKPILTWLIDLLTPLCRDLVVVLSPQGAGQVQPLLEPLGSRARRHVALRQHHAAQGRA